MTQNKILTRCAWCGDDPLYIKYHDEEWGVPTHDDKTLFEKICLEGAQAGLSWITILRKRENYRNAFDNFDVKKIAKYNEKKISQLLDNPGIVRNKLKINSTVNNARAFMAIKKEFGSFDKYIWQFTNNTTLVNRYKTLGELPAATDISKEMSKDLKKRGFKFVGPTICYAFMQAMGMVNDHLVTCYRYNEVLKK